MRSGADKRYCPHCDKMWASWWLKECPDCQGEVILPSAMNAQPQQEEEPEAERPPDPWGNWALGLGLACIIVGPIAVMFPLAAIVTSSVAIYQSTKGRSALWKGVTGGVLGIMFAFVYMEIWFF